LCSLGISSLGVNSPGISWRIWAGINWGINPEMDRCQSGISREMGGCHLGVGWVSIRIRSGISREYELGVSDGRVSILCCLLVRVWLSQGFLIFAVCFVFWRCGVFVSCFCSLGWRLEGRRLQGRLLCIVGVRVSRKNFCVRHHRSCSASAFLHFVRSRRRLEGRRFCIAEGWRALTRVSIVLEGSRARWIGWAAFKPGYQLAPHIVLCCSVMVHGGGTTSGV